MTSTKTHTRGNIKSNNAAALYCADGRALALVYQHSSTSEQAAIDGDRLAACWNACEGIADPSVVPELLEALKRISYGLTAPEDDVQRAIRKVCDEAIKKAESP